MEDWRKSRAHSPTVPLLHQRHSSFSNHSVALPTPQLFLQPFRCFTNVADHSPTLLSLLLCHMLFSYVTWQAAHAQQGEIKVVTRPAHTSWWMCAWHSTSLQRLGNWHTSACSWRYRVHQWRLLHFLTLIVPSANSVSPLKTAVENRLIHAIHKNCIVYLFL